MPRKLWLLCLAVSLALSVAVQWVTAGEFHTIPAVGLFSVTLVVSSWVTRFILYHFAIHFPASTYEELPEDLTPGCFLGSFFFTLVCWFRRGFGIFGPLELVGIFATCWVWLGTVLWLFSKEKSS